MRILTAILIFVLPSLVFAAPKKQLNVFEVAFVDSGANERFEVKKSLGKVPVYTLTHTKKKAKPQQRQISAKQAELFRSEIVRLIWKNEYRKPASKKVCSLYATLSDGDAKTKVCKENAAAVGETYGLLVSLSKNID
mgnify:CR=1 FL=1